MHDPQLFFVPPRPMQVFGRILPIILLILGLQFYAHAQGTSGCSSLTPKFINYEPCKYRLQLVNATECVPDITLLLPPGSYTSFTANTNGGWTATEISPGEILLDHTLPFVPIGTSFPLIFTLNYGATVEANFTYYFTCGIGVGCTFVPGFPLESCPDPGTASIIGAKYRECNGLPLTNQPHLSGWGIQLLNIDQQVIAETVTDGNGDYAFYDLPLGVYWVKELAQTGWSPSVPASGMALVELPAGEQRILNFGNCPSCSCDSIYTEIVQLPSAASPCNYALNVSSNAPAGCFTQFNIAATGGNFGALTATTGWNAILVDSQLIRLTYTNGFVPMGVSQPLLFTNSGAEASFNITSTYNTGGGVQTCTRAIGPFPCPPPVSPPPCCPAGNSWGAELVVNPDFQAGYTGFVTGYTAVAGGSPMTAGNASVANQAQAYASNNQWSCLDHTTFSALGLFLAVDGYAAPTVWQQNVNVTAGTTYSFYAWFNNLVIPTKNYPDPTVTLFVNGAPVSTSLTLTESPDQWRRLCGTYTAQQTGVVPISIQMTSGSSLGNDLAIDDISFRACIPPQPCQVTINATPVNNCGLVTVTATTSGGQTAAYQWCDGSTTNSYTIQLPCGPHTFCVTATCPNGATSTATVTYIVSDLIPPTCVTVPGFGVTLNPNCVYNLTPQQIDGGSTDNCQIQSLSISPTLLTGCGITTVVLTVTDWCGNTSTCSTGVQTIEIDPPVITNCPTAPVPVQTNPGVCYYQGALPALTATDNCGTVTTFNCFLFNGTNFVPITSATQYPKGNNTIRCNAVDNCGNTSLSCTYTLLVEDKEKPIISCPQSVNVIGAIDPTGQCKATINNIAAFASDNCPMVGTSWALSGATTGSGTGDASGQMFMQGVTTVVYTATDMSGNTATCSFSVNVSCGQWTCDCPQGGIPGPELITNGNFQLGNTGFTSGYAALPPTCQPQEYTVTDPVQVVTLCNNWASNDHTTGNTTAGWLFYVADGSQTLGIDAWRQQVNLTAGQTYKMCAWAKNLNFNLDMPDPVVEAYILDASFNVVAGPIATTGPLPEATTPTGGWTMVMGSYTATSSGTFHLAFRTSGTSFGGNNFALDDISFKSCTPPPPSCVCAAPNPFTGLSYKQNSGPNVPIGCGDIAIWQCLFPNFNLSGNFSCVGNGCVNPISMNWVLSHPMLGIVNSGAMTGPSFSVSIPSSSFTNSGLYTLTMSGICGTDTCKCEIIIETPGCGNNFTCDCPQGGTPGPELITNGDFQLGNTFFTSGYAALPPTCQPQEYTVTDPVQVVTLCNNWASNDHTTGNTTAGWLFYVADGSQTLGIDAWRQQVNLTAGQTYKMCAWAKNLNFNLDMPDPVVEAYILDASFNVVAGPIATTGPLPEAITPTGGWTMVMGSYTATSSGTFHLAFRTSGTSFGGNNFALDDISFKSCTPPPPSCVCAAPDPFSGMSYKQNSGPNVPIGCGDIAIWQCLFPNFNLSGNFSCVGNGCVNPISMNWVLSHPMLGIVNSGAMTGPSFSVSIPNSSFTNSGLYTLTMSGICGTDTCKCEIIIETPGCGNNCTCGQMVWAQIFKTWDWSSAITCNNAANPIVVPCLKPGQDYFIHGDFTCSSAACATNTVTWELDRPNPLINVSGTATGPYPHFDINLLGSHFTQPGIYQLTVTRLCGTTPCSCTFYFEVKACPCDCASLPPLGQQGFSVSGNLFNCKRTFKPAASLCSNDQVFWYVNFSLVGTTTGSAPLMYNFPSSGGYWVCMLVVRTDPNGTICHYAKCRFVKVKCFPFINLTACVDDVIKNGLFNEGAVPGELNGDGALNDWEWFPNPGIGGAYVDTTGGASDDGHVVLNGGANNFGAMYQQVDLSPGGNFINLEFYYNNLQGESLPDGTVLEFRLHSEPVAGSPNQVLHTEVISKDTSELGWQLRFVSMQKQINPDYKYLIVCARNTDQQRQSLVAIDNLVVCVSDTMLTHTTIVEKTTAFRLFPNPNTGEFIVELSEVATAKQRLRIVNLTGQTLYDAPVKFGQTQQTLHAESIPAGMYFLQVVTDGKVLGVEKFVKQ